MVLVGYQVRYMYCKRKGKGSQCLGRQPEEAEIGTVESLTQPMDF